MPFIIRNARVEEARKIADFHNWIWQETYRDIAPPEVAKKLDFQYRLATWKTYLAKPKLGQHTFLAVNGDDLAGLISFGPAYGSRGEIKHLYVAPDSKRQGLGRKLLEASFNQLVKDGFGAVALAAARKNEKALNFYAALGGVTIGSFTDAGPVWKSDNMIIAWDPICSKLLFQ